MRCTECGGAVVTKVFTDFRPNQNRVWFWALRCSQCEHLVDTGLRPDSHARAAAWEHPLWKSHFEN
jgi:hypothetical protein